MVKTPLPSSVTVTFVPGWISCTGAAAAAPAASTFELILAARVASRLSSSITPSLMVQVSRSTPETKISTLSPPVRLPPPPVPPSTGTSKLYPSIEVTRSASSCTEPKTWPMAALSPALVTREPAPKSTALLSTSCDRRMCKVPPSEKSMAGML